VGLSAWLLGPELPCRRGVPAKAAALLYQQSIQKPQSRAPRKHVSLHAPRDDPRERLHGPARRVVLVSLRAEDSEPLPHAGHELLSRVPRDRQAGAGGGTVLREGAHHHDPARRQMLAHHVPVPLLVSGRSQEVKGGPVVPQAVRARGLPLAQVGADALNPRAGGQAGRHLFQSRLRQVDDRHVGEACVNEFVRKERRSAAHVNDGGVLCGLSRGDQTKRGLRHFLKPADRLGAHVGVPTVPQLSGRCGCHDSA